MPRVTIVMPAYNAERHIGAAVSSALSQSFDDLELIVVDDGSTDRTADIAAAHGPRVRVIRQENAGVAAARNRGIRESDSPLVAFCDADDILFERHVELLVDVYDERGGLVTANAYWLFGGGIDPRKTRHRGRFPAPPEQRMAILQQNFVSTMSLFERDLVDRVGPFDETLRHAEDWDFWLRSIYGGVAVHHQPAPAALYRWGTGLSSQQRSMDDAVTAVLRKALDLDLDDAERSYVERRLREPSPLQLLREADDALRAGRYREATDGYARAAALVPTEAPVVWKARLLRASRGMLGPALRQEMRVSDRRRGGPTTRTR